MGLATSVSSVATMVCCPPPYSSGPHRLVWRSLFKAEQQQHVAPSAGGSLHRSSCTFISLSATAGAVKLINSINFQ